MAERCSRCRLEKPDEDFAWRRKDQGLRDSYCRPCRAEYKQEHYAKNKARYKEQAAERNRLIIAERASFLFDFFKQHPCVDCGETDPIVLEFDHLEDKSFDIGRGFRNHNWDLVLDEIAKCEVVCVNCHRRRTARRAGFQRLKSARKSRPEGGSPPR